MKKLTPEQERKRDERKAHFKQLWKKVAELSDEQRMEFCGKAGLGLVTVEGHPFSLANCMLLVLQQPTGTVFGGFRQWLKHGRCVRKGEHGAMIWVPIGHKATEPTTGETTTEMDETRFIIGTVFDIGQTCEVETETAEPLVPAMPAEAVQELVTA